jgi:hypothetical protein
VKRQNTYKPKIWIPLFFFGSLFFSTSVQAQICLDPSQNPIIWWTLDDLAGNTEVTERPR